ncbi:flagellar hook-associated protein FlgK [Novosphingobium sp. KCTC 2891]|uniref:flagellar hook-associated protein FlgK n=1 Tax=Novosphingobium sp. KCTC 2891 TaxID=2989730 RepID=UPI002223902E|nr:flagellar hook-associated protein FlgK [Novosphingobium sp. KCTC 2891]MCW1382999.1 flagellar hook-associated protein FlgK [Novosphingobium sp. KCTC 2891]
MSSDLLSIGRSGAKAARIALDVTAQNIANASTDGYVRRSASLAELASTGYHGTVRDVSLSGVRVSQIVRNADAFRQAEVRRTGSDSARADAEVQGLGNIEAALEQSNLYPSITDFESTLQKLHEDPTDTSLRASVLEAARAMTGTFQIAAQQLDAVGNGLQFTANQGVTEVNRLSAELARTNLRLSRAADASSDQTTLLDQRDQLLQQISGYGDIATTFATDGSVEVRLGGSGGSLLVTGGTANPLSATTASNGTMSFAVGTSTLALSGGSLAGQSLALTKLAQIHDDLDQLAKDIVTTVNTANTAGIDLDGNPGVALLSGNSAASIAIASTATSGRKIATAPVPTASATPVAGSRDTTNLDNLRSALLANDPAGRMDGILFDISATVAGRTTTRGALKTISDSAKTALSAQSGVDLDTEAVNLVRYQQAFQASGRVMQVATTLFDTLLNIR